MSKASVSKITGNVGEQIRATAQSKLNCSSFSNTGMEKFEESLKNLSRKAWSHTTFLSDSLKQKNLINLLWICYWLLILIRKYPIWTVLAEINSLMVSGPPNSRTFEMESYKNMNESVNLIKNQKCILNIIQNLSSSKK